MAISNESKMAIRRKRNELQKRLRILERDKVRITKDLAVVEASITDIEATIAKLEADV